MLQPDHLCSRFVTPIRHVSDRAGVLWLLGVFSAVGLTDQVGRALHLDASPLACLRDLQPSSRYSFFKEPITPSLAHSAFVTAFGK